MNVNEALFHIIAFPTALRTARTTAGCIEYIPIPTSHSHSKVLKGKLVFWALLLIHL